MALLRRGPRLWTWSSRTTADWRCASPGERDSLETASRAETERERVERESEKDSDRAFESQSQSSGQCHSRVRSERTGTRRGRRQDPGPVGRVGCRGGLVLTWIPSCRSSVAGEAVHTWSHTQNGRGLPAPSDCNTIRVGRSGVMYVLYVRVSLLFGALPPVAIDDQRRNR
jgi:hypothetical protein